VCKFVGELVNFVRVLIGAVFFRFSCTGEKNVLRVQGGEVQRGSLTQFSGYSEKAQRTGKPSYLEPNSNRMQKPIEGLSLLAASSTKNNAVSMQPALYKGGYSFSEH
jgi:hypothetical protein